MTRPYAPVDSLCISSAQDLVRYLTERLDECREHQGPNARLLLVTLLGALIAGDILASFLLWMTAP